jgi:choline-sulfatase
LEENAHMATHPGEQRRPNFLFLLADEHSAPVTGCYGSTIVDTPAIDDLAQDGVLFENAYCNGPICVPSRLSFLTGRYPSQIGAWSLLAEPPSDVPSMQATLTAHGYHTAALGKMHFVGDDHLWGFESRPYGDIHGLSHQPDPLATAPGHSFFPAGPAEIPEEDMQETLVTRFGVDFLRDYGEDRPFCLWLSYNRPHFPVRPPRRLWDKYYPDRADLPSMPRDHVEQLHPWMKHHRRWYGIERLTDEDVRAARAGYYACVELVDEQVRAVCRALAESRFADDTIVVYLSDHGELLGAHGMWRKTAFYEESVRVPFIVSDRRRPAQAGRRVWEPVQLVDLMPTVLELAGIEPSVPFDGRSLAPVLAGEDVSSRERPMISEVNSHCVPGPMRMARVGDWKYCFYSGARPSLFNLVDDPEEHHDLWDDGPVARQLCRELEGVVRRDWDERVAQEQFIYSPSARYVQVHTVHRTPNQILGEDGVYRDAETFYEGVEWSSWSRFRQRGK